MIRKSLRLRNEIIHYKIIYKNKKNLSIKLNGDKEIIVYSPYGVSDEYIEKIIRKKENWIISNLNKIEKNNFNDESYIIYRGKKFLKKVEEANIDKIVLNVDSITIRSKSLESNYINDLIYKWYIEMANEIILARTKMLSYKNNLIPSRILIKSQKSRWGSCNSKREVRLNWRLILMPEEVMDYIIVHELCHLKHMNHSSYFWDLVNELQPDFKTSKRWLKENGLAILRIK
ncbi:DUF45 domain-containing protein [Clostridium tertium]|uniref:WLM domain protein n=1 Tax=Clostridium tertium TaxID=1559 RepID=A0A6N2YDU9_9CLOT